MKISRVYIENYRSIKRLDFTPGNYCVLVGENNAGKSNILKAVNLVLGETWPTDRTFNDINREHVKILDNLLRWKERKHAWEMEAELWENTGRNTMKISRRMRSSYRMPAPNR